MMPRQTLAALAALAVVLPGAASAAGDPVMAEDADWLPQKAPAVVAHWIGEDGGVETQPASDVRSSWAWLPGDPDRRNSPLDPPNPRRDLGTPAVIVRLQTRAIPAAWHFTKARSEQATVLRLERARSRDPRFQVVTLALEAQLATLELEFTEGQARHHLTLVLTTPEAGPTAIVHKSCASLFRFAPSAAVAEAVLESLPEAMRKAVSDSQQENLLVRRKVALREDKIMLATWLAGGLISVFVQQSKDKEAAAAIPRQLFLALSCGFDDDAAYLQLRRSVDSRWAYSGSKGLDTSRAQFIYRIYLADKRLTDHEPVLPAWTRDAQDRLYTLDVYCVDGSAVCRRNPKWKTDHPEEPTPH